MKRIACIAFTVFLSSVCALAQSHVPGATTAWHDGKFHVDVAGVVKRSDIVLGRPNASPLEALPLGNGTLGVSVWAGAGLTAQVNRNDAMPLRLSPGQVVVPGLAPLASASNYAGWLDLYDGEFRESGAGMSVTAWVQPDSSLLVIHVTGANPRKRQEVKLYLWPPRFPRVSAAGKIGYLAESWRDDKGVGASGRRFGTLSGITAEGRNVTVSVAGKRSVTVSFKPYADGHFNILVAAPHYDGTQNIQAVLRNAFSSHASSVHRLWWHSFWHRAALIKVTSPHGAGEYMENLRDLDLYVAALERGKRWPGYHAGVGDMIDSDRDQQFFDPAAFWHWNTRAQVAANLGAGLADLNASYFRLYRDNLANLHRWTRVHMGGRPGVCIPETMRFNGVGYETETWAKKPALDCAEDSPPFYNARTISTGAEVSLWVWHQYLETDDRQFLAKNFPLMEASARFLLSYQILGRDGLLHTAPSNAHETQWDVVDPTTDLAAIRALYPATIRAAKILHKGSLLADKLRAALKKLPPFPRVDPGNRNSLVPSSEDSMGKDVIAPSYRPGAKRHNIENIGLEPVWPYEVIGLSSSRRMLSLERRTFQSRPNVCKADWSFDPLQAARLGLGSAVGKTLVKLTETYQTRINGTAIWYPRNIRQFFVEQFAVVAATLQAALAQEDRGVIWIASAIPPGWNFEGSVYLDKRIKVDVETNDGVPTTVAIEAGISRRIQVHNPWPGQKVEVKNGGDGARVEDRVTAGVISFQASAGASYLIERQDRSIESLRFAPVRGVPARHAKRLGDVQIGLFAKN